VEVTIWPRCGTGRVCCRHRVHLVTDGSTRREGCAGLGGNGRLASELATGGRTMYPYHPHAPQGNEDTVRGVLPEQRPPLDAALLDEPTSEVPMLHPPTGPAWGGDAPSAADTPEDPDRPADEPEDRTDAPSAEDDAGEGEPAEPTEEGEPEAATEVTDTADAPEEAAEAEAAPEPTEPRSEERRGG